MLAQHASLQCSCSLPKPAPSKPHAAGGSPGKSRLHPLIWSLVDRTETCCCTWLRVSNVSSVAAQMSQQGVDRSAGDAVDAWNDGGWWAGRVAAVPAASGGSERGAASPLRGSGRRKGNSPPAAQPPLRVLLAGSGEELLAQQVTHVVVVNTVSSRWLRSCHCAFDGRGVATYRWHLRPHSSVASVLQADLRTALEWNGADWLPASSAVLTPPTPAAAAGSRSAAPYAAAGQRPAGTKKVGKQAAPPQPYQVLLTASGNSQLSSLLRAAR